MGAPVELEKMQVKGAIRTDLILSAEIMAIALASLEHVSLLMTAVVVYGWFGTRSRVAIGTAALLTLLGAILIARRYERLARERPLH
jgi:predicted DNA repair protein MutK